MQMAYEPPAMLLQDEHHLLLCACALTVSTVSTLRPESESGKQNLNEAFTKACSVPTNSHGFG